MKIGRLLFYSLTSGSGLYLGQKVYKDGRIDLNNVGVIRFGRAAWTVGRIGVDYKLSLFSSSSPVSGSKEYEDLVSKTHYRSANRLLELCNANGGCFTKVGQHIGALDYLLPEEYTSTMKVLHSQAPKMDYEDIFAVLKEELGPDAENLFEEFDEKPLGVASLAQVCITYYNLRITKNNAMVHPYKKCISETFSIGFKYFLDKVYKKCNYFYIITGSSGQNKENG